MSQGFVGEIRMFAGNFAPAGWAFCDGQPQAISENEALFQLIGTTYGGDGQSTFNLPDLRGRVPIHQGTGSTGTSYQLGEMAGTEQVTLTLQQIPSHNHLVNATNATPSVTPSNAIPATATSTQQGVMAYGPQTGAALAFAAATIQPAGGSQPHENIQPILAINFIISLFGIFPSQN
jgi:microcystin-dependent protein